MTSDQKNMFKIKGAAYYNLLSLDDSFNFSCIQCARCCKNRSDYHRFDKIILTPYDIIRLSRLLMVTTSDFHCRYVDFETRPRTQSAEAILRFKGDEKYNICPFSVDYQCTVYGDRPMSCRIYPLGRLILGNEAVIIKPKKTKDCELGNGKRWIVREWLEKMELFHYFEFDRPWDLFAEIDQLKFNGLSPEKRDFFFRSLYDMDSCGILANKDDEPLSAEEMTLAIYDFCEYLLNEFKCLKS